MIADPGRFFQSERALVSPKKTGLRWHGISSPLLLMSVRERSSPRSLDGHGSPIEFCKRVSVEALVEAALLVAQKSDRDFFAKLQRFGGVGPPMYACDVAAHRDV